MERERETAERVERKKSKDRREKQRVQEEEEEDEEEEGGKIVRNFNAQTFGTYSHSVSVAPSPFFLSQHAMNEQDQWQQLTEAIFSMCVK